MRAALRAIGFPSGLAGLHLCQQFARSADCPRGRNAPVDVFLAVGDDDYWTLCDVTVETYIEFRHIGLKPELRARVGAHDWKFRRLMIEDVFQFFDANLRATE